MNLQKNVNVESSQKNSSIKHLQSLNYLPTLLQNPQRRPRSPYDKINQVESLRVMNTPLKRSHSMTTVIHGCDQIGSPINGKNKGGHYIDSLERFRRDYASRDQEERQQKRLILLKNLQKKRNLNLERQKRYKSIQEQIVRKAVQRDHRALENFKLGEINPSFNNSIAVNPINLRYNENQKGRMQKNLDEDKTIKSLVRTHHLQKSGTSGYNIINGKEFNYNDSLLPSGRDSKIKYERNLGNYYSRFKLIPPSITELESLKSSKKLKPNY